MQAKLYSNVSTLTAVETMSENTCIALLRLFSYSLEADKSVIFIIIRSRKKIFTNYSKDLLFLGCYAF